MLRKILRRTALALVALAVLAVVLYLAGLRILLDGGGSPYLAFVESAESQARRVEQHRLARGSSGSLGSERSEGSGSGSSRSPESASPVRATADKDQNQNPNPGTPGTLGIPGTPVGSRYWTSFRGPRRDGHYAETAIRTDWSVGLKPVWKQPVGGGYASFAIADGRAFTIEQRGREEVVAAYDVATGRELWTNRWDARFEEYMGGDGPRATPTWAGGRLFTLGALGELRALDDRTGKTIWRTNILEDNGASNLQWGMAASPLVVGNAVIVLPGGRDQTSVAAYDAGSGKRLWAAHSDQQAYSSPMLATLAGVPQILVFSASRVMGISPDEGALLWEFPWKTQFDIHASQPLLIGDNRLFLSTGYGTGAAVIELSKADGRLTAREVWKNIRMKNQFTSSLLHEGHIYGLDESILACVDAATGELKWKGGRYGYGQTMLASGHIIVLAEDGDLALVRATPAKHEEIVRFPALGGKTWNHPAMSDGMLLVRNVAEMAAFDLRK